MNKIIQLINEKKMAQVVFFVCSMVLLLAAYLFGSYAIKNTKKINSIKTAPVLSDLKTVADISVLNNATEGNQPLQLHGWIVRENSQINDIKLVLRSLNGADVEIVDATEENDSKDKKIFEIELVLAIYKSAAEHRPVKLPLEECSTMDFVGRFDAKKE